MQNLFLLHQPLVIVLVARPDSPVMDFGGFNSAAKTLSSPSFSPALDISPAPFSWDLRMGRD